MKVVNNIFYENCCIGLRRLQRYYRGRLIFSLVSISRFTVILILTSADLLPCSLGRFLRFFLTVLWKSYKDAQLFFFPPKRRYEIAPNHFLSTYFNHFNGITFFSDVLVSFPVHPNYPLRPCPTPRFNIAFNTFSWTFICVARVPYP